MELSERQRQMMTHWVAHTLTLVLELLQRWYQMKPSEGSLLVPLLLNTNGMRQMQTLLQP
jgi:hypothetical protein